VLDVREMQRARSEKPHTRASERLTTGLSELEGLDLEDRVSG